MNERWKNYFESVFSREDTVEDDNVTATEYMIDDENESEITMEKIVKALKRMKVGKAIGYHRVSSEMLRSCGSIMASAVESNRAPAGALRGYFVIVEGEVGVVKPTAPLGCASVIRSSNIRKQLAWRHDGALRALLALRTPSRGSHVYRASDSGLSLAPSLRPNFSM
ncbi:hypothetical protein EVAR_86072_1 [Eumeta japonica]|uniref:Uncharacterized protein n=1 Tax=Eumeta variegata TaxID=151549 RepID=A0A4C1UJR7_EUMVA|nr:hypothetical protein EVAR_86072_1 [Eumeta japonica]